MTALFRRLISCQLYIIETHEIFTEETFSFRYRNRIDLRCADLLASNSTSTI